MRETDITQLRRKGRGKQRKPRQFNSQPQQTTDRQQFAQQQQAFVQRQQQLVQQQQQSLVNQQPLFQQQQPQATSQVQQFANLGGQTNPINERFQSPGFLTRFQQSTQTQFGQQQPASQFAQAPQFNSQPFSNAQLQQFALQQQLLQQQQQQAGAGQFIQPQPQQQFGQQQSLGQQSRFVSFGQINGQERVQLTTPRTGSQFPAFPATPQSSFSQAGLVGGTPQPNFQSFPNTQNDIQVRPVGQPGPQQSQSFSIQDLPFQGFDFDGSNSLTDNRQQQQFFQQPETVARRPSNARPPPNADPRQKDQVASHLNAPSSSDPVSSFAQV